MINLQELPRLKDSISYIYVEHAIIEQEDSAIVAIKAEGRIPIPIAAVTCLLLGPGTSITHAAVRAICDNGCMAVWCGERATRFYAAGIGETRSAANLLHQAKICLDEEMHMQAVRRMYEIRFPSVDTARLTLQQIRGMEGARVKRAYAMAAKLSGVKWDKRSYKQEDWDAADPLNRALSEANAMLYGLCHAAIVSLGYSPGLGFVHTGKSLSFVYDIADLYKAETTIPAAFAAVKAGITDLSRNVRIACRKEFAQARILSRIARDIAWILMDTQEDSNNAAVPGELWDGADMTVPGATNYEDK